MFLRRKLLPWRRPTHAQALARRLLRSTSPIDTDDDPPFARIAVRRPPRPPSPPPKPKAEAGKIRPDEPAISDLPFDFRYSYSETDPAWKPIGFREPTRFSPFGPGRLDRPWDGVAAAARGGCGDAGEGGVGAMSREEVLGEPLSEATVAELVERYRHSDCSRQINLGELVVLFIPKCRLFLLPYARDCETYRQRNWLSEWVSGTNIFKNWTF
jgi:hypothetical protein